MKLIASGGLIFSPSDITAFVISQFASWMDRLALTHPHLAPEKDEPDEYLTLLSTKGNEHELKLLEELAKEYSQLISIVDFDGGQQLSDEALAERTIAAMQEGYEVIYQAFLTNGQFYGRADFLIKVPGQSALGNYHYEVWDSKLANSVKPAYVIQLCCYVDMLNKIQHKKADFITVALGNGKREKLRTSDYFDYYLTTKADFINQQLTFAPECPPKPEDSNEWGAWSTHAQELLANKDHLSKVAGITKTQIKKFNAAGITTCLQLTELRDVESIGCINSDIVATLQKQAQIQLQSNGQTPPLFEVKTHLNGKMTGLAMLPPRSSLDVFFDIEGNPLHQDGLEYLWGNTHIDNGEKCFTDFWAHNHEEEKKAFSDFIHWVYQRWLQDPQMHIYHYAPYEITACRKLMNRYGVCESELDQLLRNEVFVDLYKVVKGAIVLGEPKYSIKNVELIYRPQGRQTVVKNGAASVVVYEEWKEKYACSKEGYNWQTSKILEEIRAYNIDDCDSTMELAELLWGLQKKHNINYLGKTEVVEVEISEEANQKTTLRDQLLAQAELEQPDIAHVTKNMAWLLDFHRRESKPVFWKLFDRLGLSEQELVDDADCLAFCVRNNVEPYRPSPQARKLVYQYLFDTEQEFKGLANSYYVVGEENRNGNPLKVSLHKDDCDSANGIIAIASTTELPESVVLVPDEYVAPGPIPEAIFDIVSRYERQQLSNTAIYDFMFRLPPRINGRLNGNQAIIDASSAQTTLSQTITAVKGLDNSYLSIQGPPGAGKTFTGKHIIAELLKQGKKVGVTSNSHNALNNLLLATAEYCREKDIASNFYCTKETDTRLADCSVNIITNGQIADFIINAPAGAKAVGTTAWGFSREELKDQFDYLFVDEAGQVAVANLVAMSRCTSNIVLLGDQMQLGQPSQATHPESSGLSTLDYLLQNSPIVPSNMGVFLETTYRMHPKVNEFISEAFYQSKLGSAAITSQQSIAVPSDYEGPLNIEAGIRFIPVEHEGNNQVSEEEIDEIKIIVQQLVGRNFTDRHSNTRKISLQDILFVAPYNHQVSKLQQALGVDAKVGSVDKFQGKEAPIVIFSMCSSDANESARGLDFLFDKHRINVAISRAQALAIIVGNPKLFSTNANSVEQMAKVNVVAKLAKYTELGVDMSHQD
ncbi:TM0106 family RecB-like putative nuclease [Shewanella sp. 10N.286.51.B2]|uniref:TM0106 family RecB-like putative nuclease n=1 Tax=Shewanella sp. 10N.286.51.B2 TaxID=3229707 RepID=UPI00354D0D81